MNRPLLACLLAVCCASSASAPGQDGAAEADGARADDPTPAPAARFIPQATGPCPVLAQGTVTVRPGGLARDVQLWMSDAAKTHDGPLVFYWHGTNGAPDQAVAGLGAGTIAAIVAAGGIVAAPYHDPAAGMWPWYLVSGPQELDLQVADEVLACAQAQVGIDLRRIHVVGFSAGALHAVQMAYRRAGYVASVVTYSGGQLAPIPDQDPANPLAAMIFHGGANDRVVVSFQMASETFRADLLAAGRFGFICNHGLGHRIPSDATASVWRFLQDHPFGTKPSPYAAALPAGFPGYCGL
jgi:poly(3-hydroxybutyrate) depolymerase